jgi:hypothetical protein
VASSLATGLTCRLSFHPRSTEGAGDEPDRGGKLQTALGIALTSPAAHFHNDKMLWLKEHRVAIDWSGCENLKDAVAVYAAEPKRK